MKSQEIKTEKGIGTFLGVVKNCAVMLHFSPAAKIPDPEFTGDIDIIFSHQNDLNKSVGNLSLNEMVECTVNECGILINGGLPLTKDDCDTIDKMVRSNLINKYQLPPQKWFTPKQTAR